MCLLHHSWASLCFLWQPCFSRVHACHCSTVTMVASTSRGRRGWRGRDRHSNRPFWTGLFRQDEKAAVVFDPYGILTKACQMHFIKTPGNCVKLWEKGIIWPISRAAENVSHNIAECFTFSFFNWSQKCLKGSRCGDCRGKSF